MSNKYGIFTPCSEGNPEDGEYLVQWMPLDESNVTNRTYTAIMEYNNDSEKEWLDIFGATSANGDFKVVSWVSLDDLLEADFLGKRMNSGEIQRSHKESTWNSNMEDICFEKCKYMLPCGLCDKTGIMCNIIDNKRLF